MKIDLGHGDGDSLRLEGSLDRLVYSAVYCPVVSVICPHSDSELDASVGQVGENGSGCGIAENLLICICDLKQSALYQLGVGAVRNKNGDINASLILNGKVDDVGR